MQRRLACLTMQNAKGREWPATRPMTAASLLGVEPRASIAGPSARFDPRTPYGIFSAALFPLPQLYTPVGTLSMSATGHGPPGSPTRANDRLGSKGALRARPPE